MRWQDERYVRVYTRDTAEWVALSWQARAVFLELLRKVDRAGLLPIGRSGIRGLSGLVHIPVDVLEPALAELLEDGCVATTDGGLVIPNYLHAQEAKASDRARKAAQRERDRDEASASARDQMSQPVTARHVKGQEVTQRDQESQDSVLRDQMSHSGHTESHGVTPNHAVPSLTMPSHAVPESRVGAPVRAELETKPAAAAKGSTAVDKARLMAALRDCPTLAEVATDDTVDKIYNFAAGGGKRIEWLCAAIAKTGFKIPAGAKPVQILGTLLGHCRSASAADLVEPEPYGSRPPRDASLPGSAPTPAGASQKRFLGHKAGEQSGIARPPLPAVDTATLFRGLTDEQRADPKLAALASQFVPGPSREELGQK